MLYHVKLNGISQLGTGEAYLNYYPKRDILQVEIDGIQTDDKKTSYTKEELRFLSEKFPLLSYAARDNDLTEWIEVFEQDSIIEGDSDD